MIIILRLKELIYINTNYSEKKILSYGIEFKDFVCSLADPINNILLIAHHYFGEDFHSRTGFYYVRKEHLNRLLNADIYNFGDFCWVDFEDAALLDSFKPNEVAELLYFGHTGQLLGSSYFGGLKNRFAYYSHDDGWHNELYCQDINEFLNVITNIILKKSITSKRCKVCPIQDDIAKTLLKISENGLLVDFNCINRYNGLEIPIYVIGKLYNMDDLYHNLERYKGKAKQNLLLVYKNKRWILK